MNKLRDPEDLLGEIIDCVFLFKNYLNSGFSGHVYKVVLQKSWKKLPSGSTIALKIYKEELFKDKTTLIRARREAKFGRTNDHPNLLKIYGLWRLKVRDKSRYALAMEYLEGETLEEWIKHNKSVSMEAVCKISAQLFEAVECVHRKGFVHRDIKPANIFVLKSRKKGLRLKLMDFGVIKPLNGGTITESSKFVGTLRYSAPEFLFGNDYDHRIDLYSLGAVIYALIYGKPIFHDTERFSNLVLAVKTTPPSFETISKIRTMDDVVILEAVRGLLSKNSNERPNSIEALMRIFDFKKYCEWWRSRFPFIYTYEGVDFVTRKLFMVKANIEKMNLLREIGLRCKEKESIEKMKEWMNLVGMTEWGKKNSDLLSKVTRELRFDRAIRDFILRYSTSSGTIKKELSELMSGFYGDEILDSYQVVEALVHVLSEEKNARQKDHLLYLIMSIIRNHEAVHGGPFFPPENSEAFAFYKEELDNELG